MEQLETLAEALNRRYRPEGMIVYGSFADGSRNAHSDFDALLIADGPRRHDASQIGDTVLDVFLYPPETFRQPFDPMDFVQVFDGKILVDQNGLAAALQARVRDAIDNRPRKTPEELRQELDWCRKMLLRTARGDAEGDYRCHWLLCDSLEIYFDVTGRPYFGPKKALRTMEKEDPAAFRLYARALHSWDRNALADWITCLQAYLPSDE